MACILGSQDTDDDNGVTAVAVLLIPEKHIGSRAVASPLERAV